MCGAQAEGLTVHECGQPTHWGGEAGMAFRGEGGLGPGPLRTGQMSTEHFGNGAQRRTVPLKFRIPLLFLQHTSDLNLHEHL